MVHYRGLRAVCSLAAVLTFSAISAGARADINMLFGSQGQVPTDENVLMDSSSANQVFGHTNNTNANVIFTSDENIIAPAQGQARVEAADGVGYKSLCFEYESGIGSKTVEVNLNVAARSSGNVTWTAYDQFGNSFVFNPQAVSSQGANWFDFVATNGELITKVCLASDVDILDSRQWRVGGVGPANVPEGSSVALFATGIVPLVGFAIKRRKKTA